MILNLINISKNQEIAHRNLAAIVGRQKCDSTRMVQEIERDVTGKETEISGQISIRLPNRSNPTDSFRLRLDRGLTSSQPAGRLRTNACALSHREPNNRDRDTYDACFPKATAPTSATARLFALEVHMDEKPNNRIQLRVPGNSTQQRTSTINLLSIPRISESDLLNGPTNPRASINGAHNDSLSTLPPRQAQPVDPRNIVDMKTFCNYAAQTNAVKCIHECI